MERLEMRDQKSVYGKKWTNGIEPMMFVVRGSLVLRRVSMKHNSPVDAKIDRIIILRFSLCQSGLFVSHTYHNWKPEIDRKVSPMSSEDRKWERSKLKVTIQKPWTGNFGDSKNSKHSAKLQDRKESFIWIGNHVTLKYFAIFYFYYCIHQKFLYFPDRLDYKFQEERKH